jgi:hypothetical protein
LASDDDLVRAEAVRLIKLVPNDQFETMFQLKLSQMANWKGPPIVRERYAVDANALYYNRIVEWLNVQDDAKAAQKSSAQSQIKKDYASGEQWMRDDFFVGRSSKPFRAMLLYAKGIVEHEMAISDDFGKASFAKMIATLEATGEPYPSRSLHIAQALILSSDVPNGSATQRALIKSIQGSSDVDVGRTLDEANFGSIPYQIYLAPESSLSTPVHVQAADGARLLLQKGEWFLVAAKGKAGWIHYVAKS